MSALPQIELEAGFPPEDNSDGSAHLSLVEPPADSVGYMRYELPRLNADEQLALAWQVWTGRQAKIYLGKIATEEASLDEQYQPYFEVAIEEGQRARQQLAMADYPLILDLTKRFKDKGVHTQELIQEASVAMMDAIDRFEPSMDIAVSTYIRRNAYWAMLDAVIKAQSGGLDRHYAELIGKARKVEERWLVEHGDEPSDEELASELRVSPKRLRRVRELWKANDHISLDDEENPSKYAGGTLEMQRSQDPAEVVSRNDQLTRVGQAIKQLKPVERQILELLYKDEPMTLREVGEAIQRDHSVVDRRHKRLLGRLRDAVSAEDED